MLRFWILYHVGESPHLSMSIGVSNGILGDIHYNAMVVTKIGQLDGDITSIYKI